jgi:hypothetical protein
VDAKDFCSDSDPENFFGPDSDSDKDSDNKTNFLTRQFSKKWFSLLSYVLRNL